MNKQLLEKYELEEKVFHRVFISKDEENLLLKVDIDGKFKIEKMFRNNIIGLKDLENTRNELSSKQDILNYFGIGDSQDD